MKVLGIPRAAWDWRGNAMVVLLALVPTASLVQLTLSDGSLPASFGVRTFVVGVSMLCGSVALYLHHRLTGNDQSGWLCVALGVGAVPGLVTGASGLVDPGVTSGDLGWITVFRLAQALLTLAVVLAATRHAVPGDPLALALVGGLVLTLGRESVLTWAPSLDMRPAVETASGLLLCAMWVAVSIPLVRLETLPEWLRARCLLALGLVVVASALDPLARHDDLASALALGCGLLGALLVVGATVAALQFALTEGRRTVARLEDELDRVEAGGRADRARMHEIDSTIAGIASASRLIHGTPQLSESRRDVLAGMMATEVARLQRLTAARHAHPQRSTSLDDVVGRIVSMHRARGTRVSWLPCGLTVGGGDDEIAEILDVLLHNAAVHGSPDPVRVSATADGHTVRLVVSDEGPGVPPSLRSRLFELGARQAASTGQGIGLHVARDLARQLGGDLWLDDHPGLTRFVLQVPGLRGASADIRADTGRRAPTLVRSAADGR